MKTSLPENAHRELAPGEKYEPILSPDKSFKEVTIWSVCLGILMTVIFSMYGRIMTFRLNFYSRIKMNL